ncbi:MAG: hypothetical protein ACJAR2_000928 [Ilumatobacter sp.]|jgi:hypothetical protein
MALGDMNGHPLSFEDTGGDGPDPVNAAIVSFLADLAG